MCVYSVIADEYHRQFQPYPFPMVIPGFDRTALDTLRDLLERTRKLDEKLGIADCGPQKVNDLLHDLERRVEELEHRQNVPPLGQQETYKP